MSTLVLDHPVAVVSLLYEYDQLRCHVVTGRLEESSLICLVITLQLSRSQPLLHGGTGKVVLGTSSLLCATARYNDE